MKISGAHLILYAMVDSHTNKNIAILLHKRTFNAPMHPAYWSLFGGKLEEKEGPLDCVAREVKEEIGLTVNKKHIEKITSVKVRRDNGTKNVFYYCAPLPHAIDTIRLRKTNGFIEGAGWALFNSEEVNHMLIRPEDRDALRVFFNLKGC